MREPFKTGSKIRYIGRDPVGWEKEEGWDPSRTLTIGNLYTVYATRASRAYNPGRAINIVDVMNDTGEIRGYHISHFKVRPLSNEERIDARRRELGLPAE
jgi:hypothetical protein